MDADVECISSIEDIDIPIPEGEESSSVNPFPCDFCSRRFNRKSHLMNHMVTHQSERPFCCALCGVRYRRKCDLANHMKIHIGPDDESNNGTGKFLRISMIYLNSMLQNHITHNNVLIKFSV